MLRILSDESRERIHEAGLSILEDVGVRIRNRDVYNITLFHEVVK